MPETPQKPEVTGLLIHKETLEAAIKAREERIKDAPTAEAVEHRGTLAREKASLGEVNKRLKELGYEPPKK